ncbi:MAG: PEP-CTERM sorting domain-containing protein [Thiobacillus sp.]
MKCTMTKIAAAVALVVSAAGAQAAVVGPTDMRITSGTFRGIFTDFLTIPITFVNSTLDITDQYNLPGWDPAVGQPLDVLAPGAALGFALGTAATDQVNVFFAPATPGYSFLLPHTDEVPVFTGSLVNGNVSSISMRSMWFNIFGYTGNQGSIGTDSQGLVSNLTMSGCVTGVSCNWTMSWTSYMPFGPFNVSGGTWNLSGTITAVPEASTYGMLLAGLGLVGLAARRRKAQAKV